MSRVKNTKLAELRTRLRDGADAGAEFVRGARRHLHANPELSFAETDTHRYLADRLTQLGIAHTTVAGTGLLATIPGNGPGPTLALRADIDALPIREANDVPYRSRRADVMHACGHDVHAACLLGAAALLQSVRDRFPGTVRLLFQPGEEKLPGGATLMIRDGALADPRPAGIFGQHVHPPLEAGKVGFRPGIYMASTDEIYITVRGRGGHGGMPHLAVDPIVVTAQIITAAQQLVSRQTDPTLPVVLTFGYLASDGGATNVIPNAVCLQGTLRTLDEAWRAELHGRLRRLAEGIAAAHGATAEVDIRNGYPFLRNDETLTRRAADHARAFLGADNVVDLPIRMTGEDFAFYSHKLPACFYRLGVSGPALGGVRPVHTDTFDVDERCLVTGSGLLAYLAVAELMGEEKREKKKE